MRVGATKYPFWIGRENDPLVGSKQTVTRECQYLAM